jgi:hypothetical protein
LASAKDIRIKTQNTQVCRNGEEKQKQEEEEEEEEGMRKGVIYLPNYKTSTKHQQETKPTKTWLKIQGSKRRRRYCNLSLFQRLQSFALSLSSLSLCLSVFLSFAWWPLMISFWV